MESKINIWDGPFENWPINVNNSNYHDSEVWLNRATQKLHAYLEDRQKGMVRPLNWSNLPFVMTDKSLRRILHLGGASGWQYLYLLDVARIDFLETYVILETQKTAEKFTDNPYLKEGMGVRYIFKPDKVELCDLVYANSVLQYFPDLEFFEDVVRRASPRKILIDDAFVTNRNTFYAVQNAYGFEIPCSFLNLNYVISVFENMGYKLICNIPFMSPIKGIIGPLPMENFSENYRIEYPRSLLFEL